MTEHKHEQTLEDEREEIQEGNAEEEVYSEAGRQELIEDEDELTDADEGFMKGYEEGEKMTKCPVCKEILDDDFVEREFDGETYRFCSEEHAESFAKKQGRAAEIDVGEMEEKFSKDSEELESIEKDKKVLEESK